MTSPCDVMIKQFIQPKTDLSPCVKCQTVEGCSCHQSTVIRKSHNAVKHCPKLGNADFPVIGHRLQHYIAADLVGDTAPKLLQTQ